MSLNDMYTPLAAAVEELQRRWRDPGLIREARSIYGDLPRGLLLHEPAKTFVPGHSPLCVLARQVATPNFEHEHWRKQAQIACNYAHSLGFGMIPFHWEYSSDRFVSGNPDKYAWARMRFMCRIGKKQTLAPVCVKTFDFARYDGKPLNTIITRGGENFVAFHNSLFNGEGNDFVLAESTEWNTRHGGESGRYYQAFLAVFLAEGILFENFLPTKEEEQFNCEVVLPCFNELMQSFGRKPLIVRLLPEDSETSGQWMEYLPELKPIAEGRLVPQPT